MGIDDATKACIDCSTKKKGIVDGKCTECPAKEGINSVTKLCGPCFPHEGIDPTTKKCTECPDGHEVDSITRECKACQTSECLESGKCVTLPNGQCRKEGDKTCKLFN